ncbi:MAG: DoxX family protein [Kineosporiaceae bacterium]
MTTVVLAVVLAVVFGVAGTAKILGAPPMRQAARHLGFSVGQYRLLGALELAGAIGLLVGLAVPALGVAAAIGLGLLLIGAGTAHVAHHDPASRVAVPLVLLAVVAACGTAMAGAG